MSASTGRGSRVVNAGETEERATGWRELNKPWHNTAVDYCDVCGNLLIRRYWAFVGTDGETVRSCRQDDERLYHLLRRHRPPQLRGQ